MAEKSLEERVAALEEKVGEKSIAEQFAEQGRLIDQAFAHHFEQQDTKWDAKLRREFAKFEVRLERKFDAKLEEKLEEKLEQKLEQKLEVKLAPIRSELSELRSDVRTILSRLS